MYDQETGFYYVESRYYDPVIERFINADIFASTGLGILGYNMFTYCNNSPIAYTDAGGNLPQAVTDKFVHNTVLSRIVLEQKELRMTDTCIYYNRKNFLGGFGYCDLYNSVTGEVWELKKDSQSKSCRTSSALAQLKRYTTGRLKHNLELPLELPLEFPSKTQITGGSFSFQAAGYVYDVIYWSENNGILRYRYDRTETGLRKTVEAIATVAAFAVMYVAPYTIPGVGVCMTMP